MSSSSRARSAEGRRPTILIVDDVPMFRELESLFLARYGNVLTAASAAEALDAARRSPPDVLVLDLHLPDRDGPALAAAIRALPGCSSAVVVFITGGRPEEHAQAVRAGAADVIAKPLTRGIVVETIKRFVLDPQHPRGLPRVEIETPVRLRDAARERTGIARNLSRGGMFIQSDWFPPEGAEIGLEFCLPEEPHTLSPTAQCVWRRLRPNGGVPGLGVRFLALDGATSQELAAWVHERFVPGHEGSTWA